jgi:hypothetical protein
MLDPLATKLGLDAAKEALAALKRRSTKKEFAAYLSAAVTELLTLHPDIDLAEAKILAAEATGEPPSPELLRARTMLANAKTHAKQVRKVKKREGKGPARVRARKRTGRARRARKRR